MLELLKKFEEKKPEIVFEWHDALTEAKGWIVINSLRGGAAGGGTRMRKGLDKNEVESLAKTMEIKFTVAGPAIGGAKSGIDFDPSDPRKAEVLQRWFKAALPILKHYYGTGGDLYVDEIHEVIPITASLGLFHPQEGVVNGHYGSSEKEARISKLQSGVSHKVTGADYTPVPGKYTVADLITGYGVAESVIHYYRQRNESVEGKKVLVQGWGNVGAAAGYYLSYQGALISGILDRHGALVPDQAFDAAAVLPLFTDRSHSTLGQLALNENDTHKFWNTAADIFIPAAASRLVLRENLDTLGAAGLKLIACGANVPFADTGIFYGSISRYADEHFALIPDFISNCGMARVFAYLMGNPPDLTEEGIFADVAKTISKAMDAVYELNPKNTGLTASAYEISLVQLMPS